MSRPLCSIHQTELEGDGPEELFCLDCSLELDTAELTSECIEHRTELGSCPRCFAQDGLDV